MAIVGPPPCIAAGSGPDETVEKLLYAAYGLPMAYGFMVGKACGGWPTPPPAAPPTDAYGLPPYGMDPYMGISWPNMPGLTDWYAAAGLNDWYAAAGLYDWYAPMGGGGTPCCCCTAVDGGGC